jgi:hypothetical protein
MKQLMGRWQQSKLLVRARLLGTGLAMLGIGFGSGAMANGPDRDDAVDRAAEAAAKGAERAQRDEIRQREDSARVEARIEARATEDRAKVETRLVEDRAKLAADTAEQASKTETRNQQDAAKSAEDAAKDAIDAAGKATKDAADAAKDQAKIAEDAAKDAADAAKQAAKDANDAAKEARSGNGSQTDDSRSASLHDLGSMENPEFDRRGYPVRRGEVVALDLPAVTRDRANALGFRVVDEAALHSLDSVVTRLAAPAGMTATAALDALRAIDGKTHFDSAHYYGLLVGVAGVADGTAPQMAPRKPGSLRVGMIDTAVTSHVALRGTAIEAQDFTGGAGTAVADHGTAVASILAQEGSTKIVAANIFRGGGGRPFTSPDAIVRALEWMVSRNVAVINISLAGPRNDILDTLIARVVGQGHFVVAAAGNGGPAAPPAYPAAIPNVVAVTAVDRANRVYRYANQGDYIAFAATGVAIPAAAPHNSIAAYSGTSFASPHIAAELARCLQQDGRRDGTRCLGAMQLAARDVGAPGRDPVYGYGVLD